MSSEKGIEVTSFQDRLASGEPRTHFFYEYQGEREVEPWLLIDNAITLWHEHVYTNEAHDNSQLWEIAAEIVTNREHPLSHSWIEWVRFRITTGAFVPPGWDSSKAFPYKALLISAIYLQESRRLCEEGRLDRTGHLIAMAFYNLGLSTAASTLVNTSRAAQIGHARRTEKIRALVMAALDKIKSDKSATSMEKAKDKVVELLREKESKIRHWLNEFESLVPATTKGKSTAKVQNDVFDRIRNMLDDWALPSGPYPQVAQAFSHFSKRKSVSGSRSDRRTSEPVAADESDYYMRLISFLEDGTQLTVKLSRKDDS